MNLQGARVLVAGLGRSGEAAARALLRLGARVTVTDDADDVAVRERARLLDGAAFVLGSVPQVNDAELVVASPGVRPSASVLAAARASNVPVWSEVELAYRIATVPILGVTGTNGKTTTTQMLTLALQAAGYNAVAAGNIGHPLCDAASSGAHVIVAELSSFQLHFIDRFRAPVGVLLNLAPDHLDWHGSFTAYGEAKARLFENQESADCAVVLDDPSCVSLARTKGAVVRFSAGKPPDGGAGIEDGWIMTPQGRVIETSTLPFTGSAMIADAVAATAAATAFGADPVRAGHGLAGFHPAPHRMEEVATAGGVSFVNDSKATNPHAALAAIESLAPRRVVLIAGGRNKGLDLSVLAGAAGVTSVVAIGEAAPEIADAFAARAIPVDRAASMDDAVERARAAASPGDIVLLAPACASFDMFADYKARGEAFRAAVKRISSREA